MAQLIEIEKLRTEMLQEFANGNLAHNFNQDKVTDEKFVDTFLERFKPKEMQMVKATPQMLRLLYSAFDLDVVKGVKCEYCDEMITPEDNGGFMPRFNGDSKKPIILCKSALCMSSYLTYETE